MNFGSMLGGGPSGLTPEMLQQLSQFTGGNPMMGMLPPGFGMPGGQSQNPNNFGSSQGQQGSSGMPTMNPMGMQGVGMGPQGSPNYADMMRQQQMIQ